MRTVGVGLWAGWVMLSVEVFLGNVLVVRLSDGVGFWMVFRLCDDCWLT